MEYTLSYPDVIFRRQYKQDYIREREILAFEYKGRTGVVFMENKMSFMFAVNLYKEEGCVWSFDEVPEGMTFYESTWEERIWCMEQYLEFNSLWKNNDGQEIPLIGFIENNCSANEHRTNWDFCFELLSLAPWFKFVKNKDKTAKAIWKEVKKGISDTGLLHNAKKTELYCYLMGTLMIANSDCEYRYLADFNDITYQNLSRHDKQALYYVQQLKTNWNQFSWMYAMVIGRIIGTTLNTFTAIVNNLHNNLRAGYLHLYLPLIERNIDKICRYSRNEKKYKLESAIEKMKEIEQLNEQRNDLDDLYKIVFPSYFQDSMSENRPSSTIKELKAELANKEEQINVWKETADSLTQQINALTNSMEMQINHSLSMHEVSEAILSMKPAARDLVFSNLDRKLRHNKVWMDGRNTLMDKLDELEEKEKCQPSMNDNNGLVAGGNIEARVELTDDQAKMIADKLSANGNTKLLE